MPGTAAPRLRELLHDTDAGHGLLRGSVTIDQVYAHYQHERLDLRHPRGGGPKYLERPLFDHYRVWVENIARSYYEDGGKRAMRYAMEDLSDRAEALAPWEFGDLIHSGSPKVERGAHVIYERPPKRHRLTEAELRQKSRWRWPGLPSALKGWIYWHQTARGRMGLPPPRRGAA
jgi:hypothetical protein